MKQHETIANATDQPILPTINATAELEKAGSAHAQTDKSKKDGNEQPNKWVVFAILAVGIFMATLDSSIVNISLPTIARFFGVPLSGAVEWVIIAYLVVTAGVLLTIGRLADVIGRKPIWATGLIIFTVGSAICGASVSLGMLIAARALQGLGGAFIMAISPAMLTSAFPAKERGRALGMNAVIVALGVSVGPTLGGIITQNFSWRWIFYVNIPLGIIGIIATLRILRESGSKGEGRFDPVGAILLAIGLVGLTLGLSFGLEWGWNSPLLISTLVISALGFIALVFVERRVAQSHYRFCLAAQSRLSFRQYQPDSEFPGALRRQFHAALLPGRIARLLYSASRISAYAPAIDHRHHCSF